MYNWSVRPCYDCWWYSGNHRWTRTLPIGPPRSTSRKMVLFVPRPWYRCCCRHIWQATLWHALLSWPCELSAPFLLSTTWWAHNPQLHRIETWLSCTTLIPKYSWHSASYVIHEPTSSPCFFSVLEATLFFFALNPFITYFRHQMDAYLVGNLLNLLISLMICLLLKYSSLR